MSAGYTRTQNPVKQNPDGQQERQCLPVIHEPKTQSSKIPMGSRSDSVCCRLLTDRKDYAGKAPPVGEDRLARSAAGQPEPDDRLAGGNCPWAWAPGQERKGVTAHISSIHTKGSQKRPSKLSVRV